MLRNENVGYFSSSKKSPLLRWLSRCSKCVVTLPATTSTSTEELSGVSPTSIEPVNSVNRPRTLLIMCRATNSIVVCLGSSVVRAGGRRRRWLTSTPVSACDMWSSPFGSGPPLPCGDRYTPLQTIPEVLCIP